MKAQKDFSEKKERSSVNTLLKYLIRLDVRQYYIPQVSKSQDERKVLIGTRFFNLVSESLPEYTYEKVVSSISSIWGHTKSNLAKAGEKDKD